MHVFFALLVATLALAAVVAVLPPRTIERSVGKAKRVHDLRGQGVGHA